MLTVMIAEDDLLMADMLEEILIQGGYEVCGIARTVEEAVILGERHKPDLAVLDVRLAEGGLGTDIAPRLDLHKRPGILYASGNLGQVNLAKAEGEACLSKPYHASDVIRALKIVEQIISTGEASLPFPGGFHVLNEPRSRSDTVSAAVYRGAIAAIERLRRQQAALAGFGSFALHEYNLDAILTEAARVCAEGLAVPFSKVCRFRPEQNDLLVEAGVGWNPGVVGHAVSRADKTSPQGRAFSSGEPAICVDLRNDPTLTPPAFYAEHGITSTVDVVIKTQGVPYGVLEVDSPVQHDYDQHDIDFLTGFANVLAEAVNTSKRTIALRTAVDQLKHTVADKDQLLTAKTALLSEKNRLLDDRNIMAEELQHRVRNNLQLVYGMLQKQLQTTKGVAEKEGFGGIARRVMTLAQVYDHLLGTGLSRTIDFGSYLSSLCLSLESLRAASQANVTMICHSEPVTLDLDSVTALGLVISELVANSYDHAFPGGKGTISVSLLAGKPSDAATIIFTDDGVGFDEPENSKRHGLGLVRRLMQQVNGSAALRSGQGTEWILRFSAPTVLPVVVPIH